MQRLENDKQTSLFVRRINDEGVKSFITLTPGLAGIGPLFSRQNLEL